MAKKQPALPKGPLRGIGKSVRKLRLEAGLSQQQVAKRSGVSESNLSEIENEKSGMLVDTLDRLLAALNCDLGALARVHGDLEGLERLRGAIETLKRRFDERFGPDT